MKVSTVTEHSELVQGSYLDTEEMDRAGIELGATGRLKLMAKLAEGKEYVYIAIFLFETLKEN